MMSDFKKRAGDFQERPSCDASLGIDFPCPFYVRILYQTF